MKLIKGTVLFIVSACFSLTFMAQLKNIVEVAAGSKDYTTLVAAIKAAGLVTSF